jgi:hypothetical protein
LARWGEGLVPPCPPGHQAARTTMESPIRRLRRVLTVGLGLLFAYLATYGILQEGKVYDLIGTVPPVGQNVFELRPAYRVEGPAVARFFKPAHQIDRVVRPDHWTTIEHSNGSAWKNPEAMPAAPNNGSGR